MGNLLADKNCEQDFRCKGYIVLYEKEGDKFKECLSDRHVGVRVQ